MRETFKTEAEAIERVAVCDRLMGFPDNHGTLTYAIPQLNEETQQWEIEVGNDVKEKEAQNELTE